MSRKKQNAMVEYKTLTNLQHEINSRKYHNENSIEARLLQKYIYTAQDNYTVFKNNVKTLREFLKKSIDDRDAYIQKLISKKCTRSFDKIIKMMSVVSDDEDDGDTGYMLVHDQLERFRMLLINKYKAYKTL